MPSASRQAASPRPKVYVASPLGFTQYGLSFQGEILAALKRRRFAPLDPWSVPEGKAIVAAGKLPIGTRRSRAFARANAAVARANEMLIVEADALFAVLDGPDVDSGTAAEIGFASALGRKIVGLRVDFRNAGDNDGALVNLQVEHFISRSGGSIHTTLSGAFGALEALFDRRAKPSSATVR